MEEAAEKMSIGLKEVLFRIRGGKIFMDVLDAVVKLDGKARPSAIVDHITEVEGEEVSTGRVNAVLACLENDGLIISYTDDGVIPPSSRDEWSYQISLLGALEFSGLDPDDFLS